MSEEEKPTKEQVKRDIQIENVRKDAKFEEAVIKQKDELLGSDVIRFNLLIIAMFLLSIVAIALAVPWILTLVGIQLAVIIITGIIFGVMIGKLMFDKPFRVFIYNLLMKDRNYHYILLTLSGKRLVDYVVQVRSDPIKEIKEKSFIMNPNMVYTYRHAPTLVLNEKDIDPVSLDYNTSQNRDPALITDYILGRINKEKLKAQKIGKLQQWATWGILILCVVILGLTIMNYVKLDDLIKAIINLTGQATKKT